MQVSGPPFLVSIYFWRSSTLTVKDYVIERVQKVLEGLSRVSYGRVLVLLKYQNCSCTSNCLMADYGALQKQLERKLIFDSRA